MDMMDHLRDCRTATNLPPGSGSVAAISKLLIGERGGLYEENKRIYQLLLGQWFSKSGLLAGGGCVNFEPFKTAPKVRPSSHPATSAFVTIAIPDLNNPN